MKKMPTLAIRSLLCQLLQPDFSFMDPNAAGKVAALLMMWVAVLLCGASKEAWADGRGAPGVNPKDNLTKGEFFLKTDRIDGGASLDAMVLKYDRAFGANLGGNIEVPWLRVRSPGMSTVGLGDIAMRVRHVATDGSWSVIAAAEMVMPTASKDELGSGKWQLNPAIGVVYALTPTSFVYLGYRHVFSVAGDSDRADISDMQPRALIARVWPQGYWSLADLKFTKSLKGSKPEQLDLEFEGGAMVAPGVGAWVRLGTSARDSARNMGVLVGVRRIW